MILYINTINNPYILIELRDGEKVLAKKEFEAKYKQAETLLPAVDELLKNIKIDLSDLTKILVENHGGNFSSLRIGVVTANALGFALNIPVIGLHGKQHGNMVIPYYDREPNIM
ncbi:hypothetical protein KAI92_03590 [Candidatus Parcubacteria bacterium]|nr:hypothetical protein [Candidatus Parcubacteria bacterium]